MLQVHPLRAARTRDPLDARNHPYEGIDADSAAAEGRREIYPWEMLICEMKNSTRTRCLHLSRTCCRQAPSVDVSLAFIRLGDLENEEQKEVIASE